MQANNEINNKFGLILLYLTQDFSIQTQMHDCLLEGVYNIVHDESLVHIGSR